MEILCGDFLDYKLPTDPYIIVSNLPYFLARKIILKLLKAQIRPRAMYIIIQNDFFQEMKKHTHHLGISIRIIQTMRRVDFEPMPRVESVFVEILPN